MTPALPSPGKRLVFERGQCRLARIVPWLLCPAATMVLALLPLPVRALESQASGIVASVSPDIRQVFSCGQWSAPAAHGHYRVVVADVDGGAGSEVYVQMVRESVVGMNQVLQLSSTIPIRELNDDHGQYFVSDARCLPGGSIGLLASFEHDDGDIQRRIRIVFTSPLQYRITNARIPMPKPRGPVDEN